MNADPIFITREVLDDIHEDSLAQFGGSSGVRDEGLVESALGSAQNAFYYGGGDLFDIAAAYAFHIAQAQAFLDGNKRTGIGAARTFLVYNGVKSKIDDGRIYDAMIAIADRRLDKVGLAQIMREYYSASP
jgi:death-on-curing protein